MASNPITAAKPIQPLSGVTLTSEQLEAAEDVSETPRAVTRLPEDYDPEMMIFCHPQRHITLRACRMSLRDYLHLRSWGPGDRQDLDAPGYLVERPEMGPPNQKGFEFFIAWLPKANFERFYEPMGSMNS